MASKFRAQRMGPLVALLSMAVGMNFGSPSRADDAPVQPSLMEIIVTAQKRAQNLQDVPISVIAVSTQQLQDAGVTDIKNLTVLTPGLTVTSTTSENSTTARIRGIGTVGDNPGLESSVGVVIDGVYRPRNGVGFGNLGEIDRIEVLEGPQGELFGKNNDAGVINIVTKRPSATFGVTGTITGGNFDDREISGSVTGAVGSISAVRLYAGYQKRDGFAYVDTGLGPSRNGRAEDRNVYTVRGQYLLKPSEAVSFLLIGDYSKRNEFCCDAMPTVSGPFEGIINGLASIPPLGGRAGAMGVAAGTSLNPFNYQAYANQPSVQRIRDMGVSGQLDWEIAGAKLTSITAWRDNTAVAGNDADYTGVDILQEPATQANQTDFKQFSEELRVAGVSGLLDWLVGGFFASEILTPNTTIYAGNDFDLYIGAVGSAAVGANPPNFLLVPALTGHLPGGTFVPGLSGEADQYRQTSKSYALFTNETYAITEGLELTAGLRFTKENKNATANYADRDGGAGCGSLLSSPGVAALNPSSPEYLFLIGYGCSTLFNPYYAKLSHAQSLSESKVSGTVKLSYRFDKDVMAYVSYASGYKAGGFNLSRVTNPAALNPLLPVLDTSFPEETVDSYEIGLKSALANNTLRLNASVFDQRYRNFQLNTYTGILFVVSSVARVQSKGAEVALDWAAPLPGLSFSGGLTYAFTNIDEFGDSLPLFSPLRLNDRLSFAPLWSGVVSAAYELPISGTLSLRTSVSEKYSSSYNTGSDLNPEKLQRAYGLLDARIGVVARDEKWALELWGHNVTDKGYYQVGFDAPFQYHQIDAFLGDPRTFGLTLRGKF